MPSSSAMWLVVTFGSPCALNIARLVSRMRSRVWRAMGYRDRARNHARVGAHPVRDRRPAPALACRMAPADHVTERLAAELLHEIDVLLLSVFGLGALELGP